LETPDPRVIPEKTHLTLLGTVTTASTVTLTDGESFNLCN